jgi:hypothetical protein
LYGGERTKRPYTSSRKWVLRTSIDSREIMEMTSSLSSTASRKMGQYWMKERREKKTNSDDRIAEPARAVPAQS